MNIMHHTRPPQRRRRPTRPTRVNAFMNLNRWPYLLAEYLDDTTFRQVDRASIRNNVTLTGQDPHVTVVDISINHSEPPVGNRTAYSQLLRTIHERRRNLPHFDVIRPGLVARIEYSLEDASTGRMLRTLFTMMHIPNRTYHLVINPRDLQNNAVISNFYDSSVANIHDSIPGVGRLIVRITGVRLFYQAVRRHGTSLNDPRRVERVRHPGTLRDDRPDWNLFNHHSMNQFEQDLCDCDEFNPRHNRRHHMTHPPQWLEFNEFYHFHDRGRSVVLHESNIMDRNTPVYLIPCGRLNINRAFTITNTHRLFFKLSVWKNDVVVVENTAKIAQILGIRIPNPPPRPRPRGKTNAILREILRAINNKNTIQDAKLDQLIILLRRLLRGNCGPPHRPADRDAKLEELIRLLNLVVAAGDEDGELPGPPDDEYPGLPPDDDYGDAPIIDPDTGYPVDDGYDTDLPGDNNQYPDPGTSLPPDDDPYFDDGYDDDDSDDYTGSIPPPVDGYDSYPDAGDFADDDDDYVYNDGNDNYTDPSDTDPYP